MTAPEAADFLRFKTTDSLYKAIKDDGIPVRQCGRKLLFHREELDRWLAGETRARLLTEARARRTKR